MAAANYSRVIPGLIGVYVNPMTGAADYTVKTATYTPGPDSTVSYRGSGVIDWASMPSSGSVSVGTTNTLPKAIPKGPSQNMFVRDMPSSSFQNTTSVGAPNFVDPPAYPKTPPSTPQTTYTPPPAKVEKIPLPTVPTTTQPTYSNGRLYGIPEPPKFVPKNNIPKPTMPTFKERTFTAPTRKAKTYDEYLRPIPAAKTIQEEVVKRPTTKAPQIDHTKLPGWDKYFRYATSVGPSEYARAAMDQQNKVFRTGRDRLGRLSASQAASAYGNLAMLGGASQGARERLLSSANQNAMTAQQDLFSDHQNAIAGIITQDQQGKIGALATALSIGNETQKANLQAILTQRGLNQTEYLALKELAQQKFLKLTELEKQEFLKRMELEQSRALTLRGQDIGIDESDRQMAYNLFRDSESRRMSRWATETNRIESRYQFESGQDWDKQKTAANDALQRYINKVTQAGADRRTDATNQQRERESIRSANVNRERIASNERTAAEDRASNERISSNTIASNERIAADNRASNERVSQNQIDAANQRHNQTIELGNRELDWKKEDAAESRRIDESRYRDSQRESYRAAERIRNASPPPQQQQSRSFGDTVRKAWNSTLLGRFLPF